MTLRWISADALTGRVNNDLAGLDPAWPLRRTIGKYEEATARLHLKSAPPEWNRATLPMASVLAAYDDGDPARTIVWAGFVTRRTRTTGTGIIDLTLKTGEAYLDRRVIGSDTLYLATGQNTIISNLITAFVADVGGLPVVVSASGVGALRDMKYDGKDFATVYRRMQDLMALNGGPEWTLDWAWSADQKHLVPTLTVADRIGTAAAAGLLPAAQFTMPGCVISAQLAEDYEDRSGATRVTAYTAGQGNTTPTSVANAVNTAARPTIELAYSPTDSVPNQATLDALAAKTAAQVAAGTNGFTFTASLAKAPMLGRDWRLGDDVYYGVAADEFPGGLAGVGRAVSVEFTINTISPILAQGASV